MKFESVMELFDRLVANSVNACVGGENRVGIYYSGGVDSGLLDTYGMGRFERITYRDGGYKEEFLKVFPDIIKAVGRPILSFSPFAWWKCGQEAARKGLKVVLSGETGDELFGGYVRYIPESLMRQGALQNPSYPSLFPWKRDVNMQGKEDFYGSLQFLLDAERKIAAMHGISIRFPYLHPDIVKFAWSLSPEFKIDGFQTKVLMNALLKKRNPDYMVIEKHGLFCSVNKWIESDNGFDKRDYLAYQCKLLYGDDLGYSSDLSAKPVSEAALRGVPAGNART